MKRNCIHWLELGTFMLFVCVGGTLAAQEPEVRGPRLAGPENATAAEEPTEEPMVTVPMIPDSAADIASPEVPETSPSLTTPNAETLRNFLGRQASGETSEPPAIRLPVPTFTTEPEQPTADTPQDLPTQMREEAARMLNQADDAQRQGDLQSAEQLRSQAMELFRQSMDVDKGMRADANASVPGTEPAIPNHVTSQMTIPMDIAPQPMDEEEMYYRQHLSPKAAAILEAMQHLAVAYDMLVETDLPPHLSTPVRVAMENLERESQRMQRDERNVIRSQMQQRLNRLREETTVLEAILRHP